MANHPLLHESLLSLSRAAGRIPPYRGRRTNPSTIFRWLTDGVKLSGGQTLKLEAIRLVGRWLTSAEALDRFLAAQNAACNPNGKAEAAPVRTPNQRRKASESASRELDRIGI
ncbi:MAG: DUF1580 domain-containing protein [Gemmataceae bacterium]